MAEGPQSQHQDPWKLSNATAASRVSLSSTSRTECTAVSTSQPMQPRVTQHRLSQGPRKLALSFAHRSVHLVVLGPHCPQIRAGSKGLSCRRKPQLSATQQLQKYSLWSAACKCYAYHSGVASNPFVPHPQTASSKARYLWALTGNCLVHAASTLHTLAACFPRGHVQHPFPPDSRRPPLWHSPRTLTMRVRRVSHT